MFIEFSTENWLILINTLGVLYMFYLLSRSTKALLKGSNVQFLGIILTLFTWFYIGTRPIHCYADTRLYTEMFLLVQSGEWSEMAVADSEWFWEKVQQFCIDNTTVENWLLVVAAFYVGGIAFACWRWMPRHYTLSILFAFTAFSFWSYSNNGIRQGMASSLVIAGLACVTPAVRHNWVKLLPCLVLAILGCGTHNSMYLLLAAGLAAFFIPNRKLPYYVWVVCLVLSPFLSSFFQAYIGDIISDQRVSYYNNSSYELFSRTGWRWDFILYSSVPVILGWYVEFKKKVADWNYTFMLSCYLYTNAAWMLINEVPYSNRYAYISWCLYPFLLAYPLSQLPIAKNQGVVAGIFLVGCLVFNFMF